MPRPLAGCSETLKRFNEALQRFRIYALSYKALQRFTEALSNLTRPRSLEHVRGIAQVNHSSPEQSNIHELITSISLPSNASSSSMRYWLLWTFAAWRTILRPVLTVYKWHSVYITVISR